MAAQVDAAMRAQPVLLPVQASFTFHQVERLCGHWDYQCIHRSIRGLNLKWLLSRMLNEPCEDCVPGTDRQISEEFMAIRQDEEPPK
jgi:hypothetical protein